MDRQPHSVPPAADRSPRRLAALAAATAAAGPRWVEGLEPRRLFAGISLAGDGTLGVVGTAGSDAISVTLSGSQVVAKLNATTKSYPLASVRKLSLSGDAGADTLAVGGTVKLPATLKGGPGNDKLTGGGGNDSLDGGTGADDLRGGGGTDTADYSARTKSVRVQIEDVANDGEINEGDNVRSDVENVTGGSGNDVLKGSFYANVLIGGGGSDQLFGFEGNDTLRGGDDSDSVDGGAGNDQLFGDGGQDYLKGGTGADDFWGGAGGGGSGSFAYGDIVDYSDHAGYVNASLDDQRNDGATGENDYVHADVEGLFASRGGSTLIGNDAVNLFADGPGDDLILANGGDDGIDGRYGGNDTFYGGAGDDHIGSGAGNDKLYGGAGDDELEDNHGDDQLYGGAGHDRLDDYAGTNLLDGGPDADIVAGVAEGGLLGVAKSADGKTLTITGTGLADPIALNPAGGNQVRVLYAGVPVSTVSLDGVTRVVIEGRGRDDSVAATLVGFGITSAVTLRVNGGDGSDDLYGTAAAVELYGDAGADNLSAGNSVGPAKLYGGDGDDALYGAAGNDQLYGQAGNDYLAGGLGADRLYGGDGDDYLDGTNASDDPIPDYLDGGPGTDTARKDAADATFGVEKIVPA